MDIWSEIGNDSASYDDRWACRQVPTQHISQGQENQKNEDNRAGQNADV
jgi:hypothetical protein